MSDPRHQIGKEDEGLAAEYVLGTLPLADRQRAAALIRSEQRFAARVAAWEAHFSPLNAAYPEVPAPDLLPRIEARLFGVAEKPRRFSLRNFFGGAGAAAALALALFLSLAPPPLPEPPSLTATLAAEAQPLVFAAAYDPGNEVLTLRRTAGPAAAPGSAYELWVIVGEAAPVSLGLVEAEETVRSIGALPPGAILAVSREPEGGSPDGTPTEVLVTGVATMS